jgi:hypothetical protein
VNTQRGFAFLLLIVGVVILGLLILVGIFIQSRFGYLWTRRPLPRVTPAPSVQSQPSEASQSGQLYLYTVADNNLSQIEVFKNLAINNIYDYEPPVAGPEGTVFLNYSQEVDQYNLDTKAKTKLVSADKDYVFDWMTFQSPDLLFISELPSNFYGGLNPPLMIEKNLTTGLERRTTSIQLLVNGSLKYLFKASTGEDIVGTFVKEGCGASGNIYKFLQGRADLITKTGGDCNRDPVFVGNFVKQDSLVMLSYLGDWHSKGEETYDQFYLQNISSQKTTLLDLKAQNKPILSYVYNPDQNKIAIFYNNELDILDVETSKQVGPIPIKANERSFYSWRGDFGLGYFHETKLIWTAHLPDGEIKEYPLPSQFSSDVTPQIIGVWKGQPLISIPQTQ